MSEIRMSSKLNAKAELMIKIRDVIEAEGMAQSDVASLAKVTQPRISDLLKGKVDLFTVDSLMDIADAIGVESDISFC